MSSEDQTTGAAGVAFTTTEFGPSRVPLLAETT
jgi:hypothetical protein